MVRWQVEEVIYISRLTDTIFLYDRSRLESTIIIFLLILFWQSRMSNCNEI